MKDILTERIQEIVDELNTLLQDRESLNRQLKKVNDNMIAKQGAIFELKRLLELGDMNGTEKG